MKSKEIVVSRKTAYTITLVLAILVALIVFGGNLAIPGLGPFSQADESRLVAGSPEKFAVLSSHGTQGNVGST
jgi:hypothetical protein